MGRWRAGTEGTTGYAFHFPWAVSAPVPWVLGGGGSSGTGSSRTTPPKASRRSSPFWPAGWKARVPRPRPGSSRVTYSTRKWRAPRVPGRRWPACPVSGSASSRRLILSVERSWPTRTFPVPGPGRGVQPSGPGGRGTEQPAPGRHKREPGVCRRRGPRLQRDVVGRGAGRSLARGQGLPSRPCVSPRSAPGLQGFLLSDEILSPATKNGGHWPRRCSATAPGRTDLGGREVEPGPSGHVAGLRRDRPPRGRDVRRGPCRSLGFLPVVGGRHPGHHMRPGPGRHGRGHLLCWVGTSPTVVPGCGAGAARAGWPGRLVGNFYARGFGDAWEVLAAQAPRLPELRALTERFVSSFWSSDLSPAVKEAAL